MLTILQGDVIEQLRTLPDESIHCCVTSPPYWGLRDYGTAQWEGGDDGCDHIAPAGISGGQRSDRTGAVAIELGRNAILIELNPKYVELIKTRCNVTPGLQLA